jgi:acetyl esterase/lipase
MKLIFRLLPVAFLVMQSFASTTVTAEYKRVRDDSILFDAYIPTVLSSNPSPAIVFWHGGGLTVGNRQSFFPEWLRGTSPRHFLPEEASYICPFPPERANAAGVPLFSPDYRLIPSGLTTAHEILDDVLDFFRYLATTEFQLGPGDRVGTTTGGTFRVDPERVSVAGGSAGAICALFSGLYVRPKPQALLSMYGQGGNWFVSLILLSQDS